MRPLAIIAGLLLALALGACAEAPVTRAAEGEAQVALTAASDAQKIAALTQAIRALGPEVDPDEAALVARISVNYARQLRAEYGVTDPPLIHNTKVNMGLRPRGLCYQWADDIEARLRQEGFKTLTLHRAIANTESILIDHSVVIVSRRGDTMFEGIVLDGWRDGGVLFWSPTLEDPRYTWVPREVVFARKRARRGG